MKRTVAMILCALLLFTCMNPVFAYAEGDEAIYGTVPMQFSGNEDCENFPVMVQGGRVYIDCQAFAERLGYSVAVGESKITIEDSTGYTNPSTSTMTMELLYGSTQVNRTFCGGNWCNRLESPFPTVYDGETVWAPLEYVALVLNSTIKPLNDRVFVTAPEKKAPDLIYDIMRLEYFSYDWSDVYDYGIAGLVAETGQKLSAWTVSRLSRVLSMDIWDNMRRAVESRTLAGLTTTAEYGEKYATLYCTFSNDELKEETEKISAITGVFSDAVGDLVSDTSKGLDDAVGALRTELASIQKKISAGDAAAVQSYNKVDMEFEKLNSKYDSFENTFGAYSRIQEELSTPIKTMEILGYATDFVNYELEFSKQDKNSVNILKKYIENQGTLSSSVLQGIKGQLQALEKEGFCYGIIRTGFDVAGDKASEGFTKMLGLPAVIALTAWDIASNTIPFYSEGIKATDHFELSEVGVQVSQDALSILEKKKTILTQRANLSDYYELVQYSYNWLKSSYITRAAAIASLETASSKEPVQDFISHTEDINKQIAWYLVRFKDIADPVELENAEIVDQYGMFPEANEEYLADYTKRDVDAALIQLVFVAQNGQDNGSSESGTRHGREYLVDYLGMTAGEFTDIWGSDYNSGYLEGGIYMEYRDQRITGTFVPYQTYSQIESGRIYEASLINWIIVDRSIGNNIAVAQGLQSRMTLAELEKTSYACDVSIIDINDADAIWENEGIYCSCTITLSGGACISYYWYCPDMTAAADPYSSIADVVRITGTYAD